MTNEQYLSILESSAQYTKHNLSDMEDDDAVASALVDFQEGAFEVVNNPGKYGLMVVPICQCDFAMIRRDQNTQIPYCSNCGKKIDLIEE